MTTMTVKVIGGHFSSKQAVTGDGEGLIELIKKLIELSRNNRTKYMEDRVITKCRECKTWVYIYNNQQCPICFDKKEKERLEHEKQNFDILKKELELSNQNK